MVSADVIIAAFVGSLCGFWVGLWVRARHEARKRATSFRTYIHRQF
jgi:membrane protein DedA with SNARE-associated domain